jgi:hypothetical protein
MLLLEAREKIGVREPFLKNELKDFLEIKNVNTFNQTISGLAKFNIIKKIETILFSFFR